MEPTKIYFATEQERDEYNREAARTRGCDMVKTEFWYGWGKDENGFYVEVS
jgi:hypothetical protein